MHNEPGEFELIEERGAPPEPVGAVSHAAPPTLAGFARPLSPDDLITLNEEIAGMARAGLPLDQGLRALAREMGRGRLQRATAEIAADLRAGRTLPEALERQAGRVPPFYSGLVKAGVRSGRVGEVLATLTLYARSVADLRNTVVSAVLYPAVVLALALVLFGLICWFVIPEFDRLFAGFGIQLPAITRVAIELGRHPLEVVLLPPLAVVLGLVLLKLVLGAGDRGRRAWARFVYAIPIIGHLIRSARLAAFTDLLGILVDHSLPLPEAFRLAGDASSDPLMVEAACQVQQSLGEGMSLGDAFRSRKLVPEFIAWIAGLGERRGTLGSSLHQAAEMYRRQAELRAQLLRSVLPPFVIVTTASVIALFFVLALFLPLIKLISTLSG